MILTVMNFACRLHPESPDARRGILYPDPNQFLPGGRLHQIAGNGHPGTLVYKAVGYASPDSQTYRRNRFSARCTHGNRKDIRQTPPELQKEARIPGFYPYLHRFAVFSTASPIVQIALIMMCRISLVSSRHNHSTAPSYRNIFQIPGKR